MPSLANRSLLAALPLVLAGCCNVDDIDYTPLAGDDWPVSTPAAEGLDPDLVAKMYCEAERRDTLYGLLVIKNGQLVAEGYYNAGSIDEIGNRQSVTKSYVSALVGIALDQGCLSLDDRLLDFFPEVADRITDPRKEQITVRQMLQMRAGYPWEDPDPILAEALGTGDYVPLIADVPLISAPGTAHHYSNLTSTWLAHIVARACDTDLEAFAQEHLFSRIDSELGDWTRDLDEVNVGFTEIELTARDMAKFGQLYLDEGMFDGEQVLSADWVRRSLRSYSDEPTPATPGPELDDYGYGFQWWSARAGDQDVDFAWGHGGIFIFLVDALDLVVVVTGDPFYDETSARQWRNEKGHLNMVGDFLSKLPTE